MEVALLVRHAESAFSAQARVNGDPSVEVPLSAQGVRQAEALAGLLAGEPVDVAAVTEFQRTRETADLALGGRDVPRIVVPELNDPGYGNYEGGELEAYRSWAAAHPSIVPAPGGGESRLAIVERYVVGYRRLLARQEAVVAAFLHSLPIAYVLLALEGADPAPRVPLVDYARVYRLEAEALERAVSVLDAWAQAPTW